MRLIDADAVAEAINDEIEIAAEMGTHEASVCKGGLIMGLAYVNTAPTIDAVQVVRCKDCKWHQDNATWEDFINHCKWISTETPDENDFCSCGERKDNE